MNLSLAWLLFIIQAALAWRLSRRFSWLPFFTLFLWAKLGSFAPRLLDGMQLQGAHWTWWGQYDAWVGVLKVLAALEAVWRITWLIPPEKQWTGRWVARSYSLIGALMFIFALLAAGPEAHLPDFSPTIYYVRLWTHMYCAGILAMSLVYVLRWHPVVFVPWGGHVAVMLIYYCAALAVTGLPPSETANAAMLMVHAGCMAAWHRVVLGVGAPKLRAAEGVSLFPQR